MSLLDLLSGSHTLRVFGITLSLGPSGVAAIFGWALFASGAFFAVRERVTGKTVASLPPLVGAGATLAAMSAGLGLLLGEHQAQSPLFAEYGRDEEEDQQQEGDVRHRGGRDLVGDA